MKHAALISTAAVCLFGATLLGVTWAHQFGQGELPIDQQYPGPLKMAHFGKIIAGEFTGDLSPDAIVVDNGQPKMLVSPDAWPERAHGGHGPRPRAAGDGRDLCSAEDGQDEISLVMGTIGLGNSAERPSDALQRVVQERFLRVLRQMDAHRDARADVIRLDLEPGHRDLGFPENL